MAPARGPLRRAWDARVTCAPERCGVGRRCARVSRAPARLTQRLNRVCGPTWLCRHHWRRRDGAGLPLARQSQGREELALLVREGLELAEQVFLLQVDLLA